MSAAAMSQEEAWRLVAGLHGVEKRGRGKSKSSLALVQAAHDILAEIQPATVRAVCYRLFVLRLIPNMSKGSTNAVSRHIVWAREKDLIPWEWVVDETREAEQSASWRNPEALLRAAVSQYRRDYWQDQPAWVEVWSEKGTVRGTLAPVLEKRGVAFRVMHGYTSATCVNDIAELTTIREQPLHVLYVGDWDPSGLHMSEIDLPSRLTRYGASVVIHRVALTEEHVGNDLPSFPAVTKQNDPRYSWYRKHYGGECWELDALSPVTLRECVDMHIRSYIDMDTWDRAVELESAERDSLHAYLQGLPSIFGQATK